MLSVVLDDRLGRYVIRERPSMRKIIGSSSKLAVIKVGLDHEFNSTSTYEDCRFPPSRELR